VLSDPKELNKETVEENVPEDNPSVEEFLKSLEPTPLNSPEELKVVELEAFVEEAEKPSDHEAVLNEELKEQLLRNLAEMENLRKRTAKDVQDARKYGISGFAQDLINAVENIYRAEAAVKTPEEEISGEFKSVLECMKLTIKDIEKVFSKHGITRIFPKGQIFDPNLHQAIAHFPVAGVADGTIMDVVSAGYTIHERLLRPATVAVAKGIAGQPEEAS
jgi:molecular chaperone GrpE